MCVCNFADVGHMVTTNTARRYPKACALNFGWRAAAHAHALAQSHVAEWAWAAACLVPRIPLQHTATHCNAITATPRNTLGQPSVRSKTALCNTLHYVYCNALPHTATHCSTLQHITAHCNTLQHKHYERSACEYAPKAR